jgi:hypothetical protein
MCNEILGNYSKKEDQLMTAAFGTRPKRRLNRVMDAIGFEYPDYERLDKGAEGQKRKRVASALNKDDEDQPKKKNKSLRQKQLLWRKERLRLRSKNQSMKKKDFCDILCCRSRGNLKGNYWNFACQTKSTGTTSDEAFLEGKGAHKNEST